MNVNCHALHPWSFHPGGAHMLFGDGSCRFISYPASQILVALSTRAGGSEEISASDQHVTLLPLPR